MRPKELSHLLSVTIPARLPVLIKGAPGVGKSDIVAAAAKAAGAELVLMHPVVSDPTDFKGMPAVVDGHAEFLPFGDLEALVKAKKPTVAFLDDLGQAPAVVQAAAMQLILARRVNGHQVSDKVVFVAATNRREDRAGVTGILEPVKSRFSTIVELTPNVDDWCEWALAHDMPVELIAFIRFRPELLYASGQPTNDIVNRPCPRTAAHLGRLFSLGIDSIETFSGAVGQTMAAEFIGFLKVWVNLPSVDAILTSPTTAIVPTEPAALYAITTALARKASAKTAERLIQYLTRLPEEFSVLGIIQTTKVCPEATNCAAFIKWATTHQDVLS
jgi:hypothetical protein